MKVKFKNFKAFKGIHQINVKPLTVIIGKNNSGKSTISEAIDYYTRLKNSHYRIVCSLQIQVLKIM
jgi:AAA15 family ATPase/GTPase